MSSDPRAAMARRHHEAGLEDDRSAARHRRMRNKLVRTLREEDPALWTYPALAGAIGCSPELIAKIVKHPE